MADVGWAGMYVNIAPYGVTKLKEESYKLQRDVNDPALPTLVIKFTATGWAALMSYPINYCPVEKPELGVGGVHLPVIEALRDDEDARNFPTSDLQLYRTQQTEWTQAGRSGIGSQVCLFLGTGY